tara:strand:+ start:99 stop:743 length:645 start_codon:yes stop_codon:yes gene_type:complete
MANLKSEKDVWMNKLRQVNPHWKPKKYEDNEELNDYYDKTWSNTQVDPVQQVLAQQIEELEEHDKPLQGFIEDQEAAKQMAEIDLQEGGQEVNWADVEDKPEEIEKIQKELEYKEWANKANSSNKMKENRKMNPSKYTENELEQAKEAIIEKITKHFDDVLFEMVCEEMSENYLFQSSNYLTEAGYDLFEDEWFEFYHEHHGDILYQLRQTIFE